MLLLVLTPPTTAQNDRQTADVNTEGRGCSTAGGCVGLGMLRCFASFAYGVGSVGGWMGERSRGYDVSFG